MDREIDEVKENIKSLTASIQTLTLKMNKTPDLTSLVDMVKEICAEAGTGDYWDTRKLDELIDPFVAELSSLQFDEENTQQKLESIKTQCQEMYFELQYLLEIVKIRNLHHHQLLDELEMEIPYTPTQATIGDLEPNIIRLILQAEGACDSIDETHMWSLTVSEELVLLFQEACFSKSA